MWGEYSQANALNPAQRHRWRLVLNEIGPLRPGAVVVDLGCGSGTLLHLLHERAPQTRLIGLDIEPLALELARKNLPSGEFHRLDLGKDTLIDLLGIADVVLCSEVLEHVDHPEHTVELARTLLRPGGRFVITVPSGPKTPFDLAIGHIRHYDLDAVRVLFEGGGFRVQRAYRWGFPFHTIFRIAVGLSGAKPSQYSDQKFSAFASLTFRLLYWTFFLNGKRRRWGRQIVAVAEARPA
jgi:SAM-dependent methyltransferase